MPSSKTDLNPRPLGPAVEVPASQYHRCTCGLHCLVCHEAVPFAEEARHRRSCHRHPRCQSCGEVLKGHRADARFCGPTCRKRGSRGAKRDTPEGQPMPATPGPAAVTFSPFSELGNGHRSHAYEGGLAPQPDVTEAESEVVRLCRQLLDVGGSYDPERLAAVERVKDHLSGLLQVARLARREVVG